jgi:hypothetical protein
MMANSNEPTGIDNIVVRPVYLRAVNAIVQPEIQVPCSLYYFQNWLPRLGTLRWSLVLALRSICNQRQPDGTVRGEICRAEMARILGVHEATISRILTTAPSPVHQGWRILQPVTDEDQETAWLARFIPRLRYKYERDEAAGVTRRIGYIIDVIMDDPLVPEDEQRLAVILAEQVLQSMPGLPTVKEEIAPAQLLEEQNAGGGQDNVKGGRRKRTTQKTQLQGVKKQNVISHSDMIVQNAPDTNNVQEQRALSRSSVNPHIAPYDTVLTQNGSVLTLTSNYIYKEITVDLTLKRKRDIRAALAPLVDYAAQQLRDDHSKGMFYSTAVQLYPNNLNVFTAALEAAEREGRLSNSVNMGAVFVNVIRETAARADVALELGKKKDAEGSDEIVQPEGSSAVREDTASLSGFVPGTAISLKQMWPSVLQELKSLTSRASYEMWLRNCTILGIDRDTIVVGVPTAFARDWINERLLVQIRRALSQVIGRDMAVRCEVQELAGR